VEREEIASTPNLAMRAMKLFFSPHFNPHDPECAKLSDGLTAETAGVWGQNLQARQANLLSLGEKGMAKVAKKRAKAPVDPLPNLFAVFGEE
jgi:hypothetical protein